MALLRFFFCFTYTCFPHVGLSLHLFLISSFQSIPQYVSPSCFSLTHVYRLYFDACISYMLLTCLLFTYLLLYHFELFGRSRVTGPLDGAEIDHCHGSHCPWPAVTSLFINYWLTYWPKFKFHCWYGSIYSF